MNFCPICKIHFHIISGNSTSQSSQLSADKNKDGSAAGGKFVILLLSFYHVYPWRNTIKSINSELLIQVFPSNRWRYCWSCCRGPRCCRSFGTSRLFPLPAMEKEEGWHESWTGRGRTETRFHQSKASSKHPFELKTI